MTPGIVAFFAGLTLFCLIYAVYAPMKRISYETDGEKLLKRYEITSGEPSESVSSSSSFDKYIRPILRGFLPQAPFATKVSVAQGEKINSLLLRSGNPWSIKPIEYRGLQFLFAFIGAVVGLIVGVMAQNEILTPPLMVAVMGLLGFVVPRSFHVSTAEKRAKEIDSQFPEALDLIRIAMSSSLKFGPALAAVTPKMPDGVLKEEFNKLNRDLRSNLTLEQGMMNLRDRAPSDSISSFAWAIIQSESLGVPAEETIKSQADNARAEYENRVEKMINKLTSQLMLILLPTIFPAFLIALIAPLVSSLSGLL